MLVAWLHGALFGTLLGVLLLGVGGRAAMRVIGVVQGTPPGFSLGGTATIVFLGAASGLAGGLIYATCRVLLPKRPTLARTIFGVVFLAITLRGLRPLDVQRLSIFLPLFIAFAFAIDRLWERRTRGVMTRARDDDSFSAA